jgi:hypothetical protein
VVFKVFSVEITNNIVGAELTAIILALEAVDQKQILACTGNPLFLVTILYTTMYLQ